MSRPIEIIALVLVLLVACAGQTRHGASPHPSPRAGIDAAPPDPTAGSSMDAGGEPSSAGDGLLEAGFRLMAAERVGDLRIGMSDTEVVALLGDPPNQTGEGLAEADGMHYQTWEYPEAGISLAMRAESPGGAQTVGLISVFAPCSLQTSRGVHVGSSVAAVRAAYGGLEDPETTDESVFVAGTVYGGVFFVIEDLHVTEITVGAVAE